MKISFIVPVYKVESYIHQCVKSLTTQTYDDIEIILVDDGSPDNCPAICDQLAIEDKRIHVIHKENGGLSDARNKGLLAATGDYVTFVDSDDYWDNPGCLQELVSELKKDCSLDFIGFNFKKHFTKKDKKISAPAYSEATLKENTKNDCLYSLARQGVFPISACTKLIRREFLLKNNLFFIKGLISEDIPWFIDLICSTEKCKFLNLYIYNYRQNVEGSITNSFSEKKLNDRIGIIKNEICKIDSRSLTDKGKHGLYFFLAYEFVQLIPSLRHLHGAKKRDIRKDFSQILWLLDYDLHYKVKLPKFLIKCCGLTIASYVITIYNKIR